MWRWRIAASQRLQMALSPAALVWVSQPTQGPLAPSNWQWEAQAKRRSSQTDNTHLPQNMSGGLPWASAGNALKVTEMFVYSHFWELYIGDSQETLSPVKASQANRSSCLALIQMGLIFPCVCSLQSMCRLSITLTQGCNLKRFK